MISLKNLIFERIDVKKLEVPFSQEEIGSMISRKVIVTKSIPIMLRKRYTGNTSMPYFTGVVNQNKIELLYNPCTNTFIRVSAKIVNEFNGKCTLEYSIYDDGEFMAIIYYSIPIQLVVLMTWGLSHNGGFTELVAFIGLVLIMIGVRIVETHKILFDQRITTRLKLISFPGMGIISITVLCTATVLYFMIQNTKIIWQLLLVLIFFFLAFRFLRSMKGNKFVEDKFLECFK